MPKSEIKIRTMIKLEEICSYRYITIVDILQNNSKLHATPIAVKKTLKTSNTVAITTTTITNHDLKQRIKIKITKINKQYIKKILTSSNVAFTLLNQISKSGIIRRKRNTLFKCNLSSMIFFKIKTSSPTIQFS
jgi:isochorismate synthase EntC